MGMVKINNTLDYNGETYLRISLKGINNEIIQKTLFEKHEHITLYVLPCNANLYSPWVEFIEVNVNFSNLEKTLNKIAYYNCNNKMGNRLHYYIKL